MYGCRIIEKNNGHAPLTYQRFQVILASIEPPPHPQEVDANLFTEAKTPIANDHDDMYAVPTLEELGKRAESIYCLTILFQF